MSGSVKITDVHAEFGLQMDKGSVNRFKRSFSGTVKQLKEGTKEIGFSAVSSLEGVAKQGGLFGSIVGGGVRGLMTGGVIKAVIASAVAGIATIGVAAKNFCNEFDRITDKFADIIDTADALNMEIQDIERLKYVANLKGAKYEDFIKLIQQTNKISGSIKTEGLTNFSNKKLNYIFSGDGTNLSGFQKLDILTQYFTKLHKEQGEEVALDEITKLFPFVTRNSAIFAALTSGNAEILKGYYGAKVIPQNRTKEVRDKVQKGRETVAQKKNEQSYQEDIRYLDKFEKLKKSYTSMNEISETLKDTMYNSSTVVAGGVNILNKSLKTFNSVIESIKLLKNLDMGIIPHAYNEAILKQRAQQKKEIVVTVHQEKERKINVFNNNTTTNSLR